MAAESQYRRGVLSVVGGLLVCGVLICLPEAWAGKVRSFVRDSLSPGQCVIAATAPNVVGGAASGSEASIDSSWQRQARYWQAEAARLKAELAEANKAPGWPEAATTVPLVKPLLRQARVIGWERRGLATLPAAVIRGGTANQMAVDDLVLAPGESILDQGQGSGIAADDLILAGRTVIGRITRVSRWTSTIQPVSDAEFRGQAQIVRLQENEAILGAEGILTGTGKADCRLLHVGATEPVAEGDLVFTSLRGVPLSQPLFYGTITRAELVEGDPDWSISVTPALTGTPPSEVQVLGLSIGRRELQPSDTTEPKGGDQ
ncbi:MAG: rod shape-determining protein MreC [Planctomycetaceae bacterium]